MPTTSNKGYQVPVTGTEEDTWGNLINTGTTAVIDSNLGGLVTKTLASSTVNLDATESQNLICRLIGTLGANVLVTTLAKGMTIVENATSGAFAVTFQLNGVGSPVTIPQGTRAVVITDGTNGARVAADNQTEFASGTTMPFYQTAAPTGWTKVTASIHNKGVRITTGVDGGTTAGSADFSDIFTTRAITGSVGGTAITIAQMPAHTHDNMPLGNNNDDNQAPPCASNGGAVGATFNSSSAGGGQSHDHSLSINNLNMSLAYLNMIVATKN